MRAVNNNLGVVFDEEDKRFFDLGNGVKLERADAWRFNEGTQEKNTRVETNVNHLEVNPQFARVVVENPNLPYKCGDIVFLHYLAYETFEELFTLYGEDKVCFIEESYILFKIEEDKFILPKGVYLAEEVLEDAPQTSSGIFLTPFTHTKDDLVIRIKHCPVEDAIYAEGDLVISLDVHNYPIEVFDQNYFVIKEDEIVGKRI